MSLALACAIIMLGYGVDPGVVALAVATPFAFLIFAMEWIMPYRRDWLASHNDVGTDIWHLIIVQILIPRLITPLWAAIFVVTTGALSARFGSELWPHQWPLLAQLFLMLVIAEFGRYWVHRAAHEIPWLWRLHAVHHSPKRLYWLNAARFHPIEKVIFLIPETIPFILLGTSPETLALYAVFNSLHGLFQHSNINLKLGVLNRIFSMTELHRWHHSKEIAESNKNYGNNLILWDIVFGTYFLPKGRRVTTIGLLLDDYPEGYLSQLTVPFTAKGSGKPE
jgi:sterol desaturase/sphingolipid hydroxylase (fatty acid hydroxylase superfamily)